MGPEIAAAKDCGIGALVFEPRVRPPAGAAHIDNAVSVFRDRHTVVVARRRDFFPMAATVKAAKNPFSASGEYYARLFFTSENLVYVGICEAIVSRPPALSAVFALQHAADLDAHVK